MHPSLLALLRCPFCGSALTLQEDLPVLRDGAAVLSAVLGCPCCAYPVVAGIPVVIAGERERAAMQAIEAGRHDHALELMLELDGPRRDAFHALVAKGAAATYRDAIGVLSPDAEGTYFIYRLSDPTYVTAAAVLRALAQTPHALSGWTVDVCGGSGHLTRVLAGLRHGSATAVAAGAEAAEGQSADAGQNASATASAGGSIIADVYFWKLWLATRMTAPGSHAVCCDANDPLPFVRGFASLVLLSDAFPYIWRRRALAEELIRLVDARGTLLLPHLHSALGENFSAGMTLPPAGYADLFAPIAPRLYPDRQLFTDVVAHGAVDLTTPRDAEAFGDEPSLTLVASRAPEVFARFAVPAPTAVAGALAVNPLYESVATAAGTQLTLTFPTPEYAEEFAACRRYLPDALEVAADLSGPLDAATLRAALGAEVYDDLRRRLVLIDAPPGYC